VIEIVPRRASEKGRYYHKCIAVENNEFRGGSVPALIVDNVETVIFRGNRFTESACHDVCYVKCGKVTED
jgi:hypothetical protein